MAQRDVQRNAAASSTVTSCGRADERDGAGRPRRRLAAAARSPTGLACCTCDWTITRARRGFRHRRCSSAFSQFREVVHVVHLVHRVLPSHPVKRMRRNWLRTIAPPGPSRKCRSRGVTEALVKPGSPGRGRREAARLDEAEARPRIDAVMVHSPFSATSDVARTSDAAGCAAEIRLRAMTAVAQARCGRVGWWKAVYLYRRKIETIPYRAPPRIRAANNDVVTVPAGEDEWREPMEDLGVAPTHERAREWLPRNRSRIAMDLDVGHRRHHLPAHVGARPGSPRRAHARAPRMSTRFRTNDQTLRGCERPSRAAARGEEGGIRGGSLTPPHIPRCD